MIQVRHRICCSDAQIAFLVNDGNQVHRVHFIVSKHLTVDDSFESEGFLKAQIRIL